MVGYERYQCNLPGTLDCSSEGSLVFCANASPSAGLYLSPLSDEPSNLVNLFVINVSDFFHTKRADFATPDETSARPPTWAARPTRPSCAQRATR